MKLRLRALELRVYAALRAWHYHNLVAGLDFKHFCARGHGYYDPVDHMSCPKCRILGNRGAQGRRRRLLYRFLEWRMAR